MFSCCSGIPAVILRLTLIAGDEGEAAEYRPGVPAKRPGIYENEAGQHHAPGVEHEKNRALTGQGFRSIVNAIFRKGALPMNWFGSVSMMPANTENHVRTIVVYDCRKFREA